MCFAFFFDEFYGNREIERKKRFADKVSEQHDIMYNDIPQNRRAQYEFYAKKGFEREKRFAEKVSE